ncbi:hypothetical protein BPNPMPFG_008376 (plasmid) [Mesorhizobium sp. AR07]|uniref:hypothetical protein n=1 Tax=Mesorhizobium sp. AR07 TaxID=2865838 RepID=UPI002160AC0A|nr:hypothetical protein [Mesorhizobium sp. AR07]UVK49409.1 hypothetical protein BPNPMPFG_008376 [Mesorhizobium sp. AR07]
MVKSIEQAMADAILAIRILRKSIADHGHSEAMIDFDRLLATAVDETEKQLTKLQDPGLS